MDKRLIKLMREHTPDLNPLVANGVAVNQMESAQDYIEQVLNVIAEGFPEGLRYEGSAPVSPKEEFDYFTSKKQNKRTIDLARSDIYLRKYIFSLDGKRIERNIALPFVGKGGTFYIRGTKSNLAPIMSDKVISPANKTLFVKLVLTMFIVDKVTHHFSILTEDGGEIKRVSYVPYSNIYKNKRNQMQSGNINAETTLLHYLFCKYGVTESFKKIFGFAPIIMRKEDFSFTEFPEDEYIACGSAGKKPGTYKTNNFEASDVLLVFEKSRSSNLLDTVVCTFFYLLDHFPQRARIEHLEKTNLWRILLGQIIWSDNINEAKLLMDVDDHMTYVDQYVCKMMKRKFEDIGLEIDDTYDLFVYLIRNLMDIILSSSTEAGDLSNKELLLMPYVLSVVVEAINKFYYAIRHMAKKQLNPKNVGDTLNRRIAPTVILSAPKTSACVQYTDLPNDSMVFKLTSAVIAQEKSNKLRNKTEPEDEYNPNKLLHPSLAAICNYAGVTKADASGRGSLNPMVQLSGDYGFVFDDRIRSLMDKADNYLKHRVRPARVKKTAESQTAS